MGCVSISFLRASVISKRQENSCGYRCLRGIKRFDQTVFSPLFIRESVLKEIAHKKDLDGSDEKLKEGKDALNNSTMSDQSGYTVLEESSVNE